MISVCILLLSIVRYLGRGDRIPKSGEICEQTLNLCAQLATEPKLSRVWNGRSCKSCMRTTVIDEPRKFMSRFAWEKKKTWGF